MEGFGLKVTRHTITGPIELGIHFMLYVHLFPPNLGGSARILDIVHPISAVPTAYLTVKLKQCI